MIGFRQPGMMAGMLLAAICLAPASPLRADPSADRGQDTGIEEFVVTSRRREEPLARNAGNLASLDSESIDSLEIGMRWSTGRWSGDAALFAM